MPRKSRLSNATIRQQTAMTERQRVAAELYLAGNTHEEIARQLNTTAPNISKDLKRVREEWRARAAQSYDDWLADHTARTERLYREAWEAWERSKASYTVRTKSGDLKTITPAGDPRFLERMEKLLNMQARVRGALNGDVNVTLQAAEKGYDWDALFPKKKPVELIDARPMTNGDKQKNGD